MAVLVIHTVSLLVQYFLKILEHRSIGVQVVVRNQGKTVLY